MHWKVWELMHEFILWHDTRKNGSEKNIENIFVKIFTLPIKFILQKMEAKS